MGCLYAQEKRMWLLVVSGRYLRWCFGDLCYGGRYGPLGAQRRMHVCD